MFRRFVAGKHGNKTVGYADRVYHLVFGVSRMYIASLEHNLGGSRIEILELQLAHFTAIHGIGPFAAELLDIELMRSQTYFLVGIETDTDFTVFDFRMLFQIGYRRNNLRDTRFVIGAQQSLSVGDNQSSPLWSSSSGNWAGERTTFPSAQRTISLPS